MVEIVKLRVILDVEEDVFRDLEIEMDAPLMHLHLATLDAFNWNDAHEMASFYKSNDAWDKGDEFPLMAMSPELPSMESAKVRDVLPTQQSRGLYVYDYLRMWCFYLEPIAMSPAEEKTEYPRLMLEFGETPNPLSREPEGLNDADLFADVFGDETNAPDKATSTGDPELDAYLADDAEEDASGGLENIDDYDDIF